MPKHSLDMDQM